MSGLEEVTTSRTESRRARRFNPRTFQYRILDIFIGKNSWELQLQSPTPASHTHTHKSTPRTSASSGTDQPKRAANAAM